jgi:hypothetical protein
MTIYYLNHLYKNRGLKKSTSSKYYYQLVLYCKFLNKTPTELINEAEKEENERIRMRSRSIKKYLFSFKDWLKEK